MKQILLVLLVALLGVMLLGCNGAQDGDSAATKAQWIADQVRWSEQLVLRAGTLNPSEVRMLLAENALKWQRLQKGGPWQ